MNGHRLRSVPPPVPVGVEASDLPPADARFLVNGKTLTFMVALAVRHGWEQRDQLAKAGEACACGKMVSVEFPMTPARQQLFTRDCMSTIGNAIRQAGGFAVDGFAGEPNAPEPARPLLYGADGETPIAFEGRKT